MTSTRQSDRVLDGLDEIIRPLDDLKRDPQSDPDSRCRSGELALDTDSNRDRWPQTYSTDPNRAGPPRRNRDAMLRQLDQRKGDGLTVTLEWDSERDRVWVRCEDETLPDQALCYPVEPCDARLAFLHPFALRPLDEN
jgi:hypothetical protein